LLGQVVEHVEHHGVVDPHRIIDHRLLIVGGQTHDSDAFGDGASLSFDLSSFHQTENARTQRVSRSDFDRGIFFFEESTHSRNRSTTANRANKMSNLTRGLLPDLWPRGLIMNVAVGGVFKLIGPNAIGCLSGDAFGLVIKMRLIGERHGRNRTNLSAQRLQQIVLLLRLIVGHRQNGFVST